MNDVCPRVLPATIIARWERPKVIVATHQFCLLVGGQPSEATSAEGLVLLVGGDFDLGVVEGGATQWELCP